jgi:hypothetical protein
VRAQQELGLSYSVGDYVWVKDDHADRLLARIDSARPLRLLRGEVWLVRVKYPTRWGTVEHRRVVGVLTPMEIAARRTLGTIPAQGEPL